MFLHMSVCLQGGGHPHCMLDTPPWADTLSGQTPSLGRHPLRSACWDTVNKRAVRIPLECNLVYLFISWVQHNGVLTTYSHRATIIKQVNVCRSIQKRNHHQIMNYFRTECSFVYPFSSFVFIWYSIVTVSGLPLTLDRCPPSYLVLYSTGPDWPPEFKSCSTGILFLISVQFIFLTFNPDHRKFIQATNSYLPLARMGQPLLKLNQRYPCSLPTSSSSDFFLIVAISNEAGWRTSGSTLSRTIRLQICVIDAHCKKNRSKLTFPSKVA